MLLFFASFLLAFCICLAMLLAIDPGKNIGLAIVNAQGTLLWHAVQSLELCQSNLEDLLKEHGITHIVLGDGTGSARLAALLKTKKLTYTLVEEYGTSLQGKRLYYQHNKPKGFAYFVPQGLRANPKDIDAYAAYAIALRYLGLDV